MNTATTDHILAFAQSIADYLRINKEYRAASRNPDRRQALNHTRTQLFLLAERDNAALHQHLNSLPEPDYITRNARELIARWDRRNHCFNQLSGPKPKGWSEAPNEAIIRLNIAEKKLVDQLKIIHTIIAKIN